MSPPTVVILSAPSSTTYFVSSSRTMPSQRVLSSDVPSNASPSASQPQDGGSWPSSVKYSNGTVPTPAACGANAYRPKAGASIALVTVAPMSSHVSPSNEYSPLYDVPVLVSRSQISGWPGSVRASNFTYWSPLL